jgi:hypothetical protein
MLFPPAKEDLNVPSKLVDESYLFSFQVKTVGGNIELLVLYSVADDPDRLFSLVLTFSAQKAFDIQKHVTIFNDFALFQNRLSGALSDAADKMLLSCLPLVKVLMALVVSIHNTGLPWLQYLGNERAFISLACIKKKLFRDSPVQVKADMHLGLVGTVPVVGPLHGGHGIDQ